MKVLLVLDHAPDYRESFLRALARECDLTVLAQPCDTGGLKGPECRSVYKYVEVRPTRLGPVVWQSVSALDSRAKSFDVLCVAWNARQLWRVAAFFRNRQAWGRWVWWGQIYGKSENRALRRVRAFVLGRGSGALVYSSDILARLRADLPELPAESFNNSSSLRSEFRTLDWPGKGQSPRFLFVGRPQDRKRLDRALQFAEMFPTIRVRLVGPGMYSYLTGLANSWPENIEVFEGVTGAALAPHFEWAHMIINPGHLGLLAVTAAQHGRPLAIQRDERHAPEVILAREADQIFLDFADASDLRMLVSLVERSPDVVKMLGKKLYDVGFQSYSVEGMVETHISMFNAVMEKKKMS